MFTHEAEFLYLILGFQKVWTFMSLSPGIALEKSTNLS